MVTDTNKQIVRNLYENHFNTGRLDHLDDLVSPDFVGVQGQRGAAAMAAPIVALRAAFPDIVYTVDDIVAEGDRVAIRWTWHGTHKNAFRNWAPTGKQLTNTGLAIMRLVDSKIVSVAIETDRLGFLLAIGAVPYDPAFGPPPTTK